MLLYEPFENVNNPAVTSENENILNKLEIRSGIVSDKDKNYNRIDILNKIVLFKKIYPMASILDTKAKIVPIIKPSEYSTGHYILQDDPEYPLDTKTSLQNHKNAIKNKTDNITYCNYDMDGISYYVTDKNTMSILDESNSYFIRTIGSFSVFILFFIILILCISTIGFSAICFFIILILLIALLLTVLFAFNYFSMNNIKRNLLQTKGSTKCTPKIKSLI